MLRLSNVRGTKYLDCYANFLEARVGWYRLYILSLHTPGTLSYGAFVC